MNAGEAGELRPFEISGKATASDLMESIDESGPEWTEHQVRNLCAFDRVRIYSAEYLFDRSGRTITSQVDKPPEEWVSIKDAHPAILTPEEMESVLLTNEERHNRWISFDPAQVNRALGSLLHNAIKFTPPEGQVWVRARPSDGDVLIEVADTGPGIPPEDLPRVFERFFRGDRARVGGGTGLGLAIAKHVVEAHGGKIWVESEGRPGRGATFRFTLLPGER